MYISHQDRNTFFAYINFLIVICICEIFDDAEVQEKLDDNDIKEDSLEEEICDEEEYNDLSDEDYEKMLNQKIAETEFVKAIVIWVG